MNEWRMYVSIGTVVSSVTRTKTRQYSLRIYATKYTKYTLKNTHTIISYRCPVPTDMSKSGAYSRKVWKYRPEYSSINYIKYSLDFLCTELNIYSRTAENFEAVEWATGFSNKNGCIVGLIDTAAGRVMSFYVFFYVILSKNVKRRRRGFAAYIFCDFVEVSK